MAYIRSPELIHLLTGSLYSLTSISPVLQTPALTTIVLLWFWVQLFKIPHISEIGQYLSFCAWFVSLSKVFHVVAKARTFFSFVAERMYIPRFLSIHPLTDTGCFHILAIMNISTLNMEIHISLLYAVFISLKIYAQKWNCWVIW